MPRGKVSLVEDASPMLERVEEIRVPTYRSHRRMQPSLMPVLATISLAGRRLARPERWYFWELAAPHGATAMPQTVPFRPDAIQAGAPAFGPTTAQQMTLQSRPPLTRLRPSVVQQTARTPR
eukprot:9434222-Prorocentrum_lima.AAC.1